MIEGLAMLSRVGASGFLSGIGSGAQAAPAIPTGGGAGSFGAMLGNAMQGTVGSLEKAEQVSMQALSGDADTRQVVDAVMSAEQSLQTAISIRDKIVSAYLEISRMTI